MKSILSVLGIIFILALLLHLFTGFTGMGRHWGIPSINSDYRQSCRYSQGENKYSRSFTPNMNNLSPNAD